MMAGARFQTTRERIKLNACKRRMPLALPNAATRVPGTLPFTRMPHIRTCHRRGISLRRVHDSSVRRFVKRFTSARGANVGRTVSLILRQYRIERLHPPRRRVNHSARREHAERTSVLICVMPCARPLRDTVAVRVIF